MVTAIVSRLAMNREIACCSLVMSVDSEDESKREYHCLEDDDCFGGGGEGGGGGLLEKGK